MQTILDRLGACKEAREWVGGRTLAEAWAECKRPDWMLWLHARSDSADADGYASLANKWAARAEARATAAEWAGQCNDIRAALCCPVFNTPGEGGKDGSR